MRFTLAQARSIGGTPEPFFDGTAGGASISVRIIGIVALLVRNQEPITTHPMALAGETITDIALLTLAGGAATIEIVTIGVVTGLVTEYQSIPAERCALTGLSLAVVTGFEAAIR